MTSLAEAYEENVGEVGNLRRLYLGVGLFVAGALLVVLAILISTTGLQSILGLEWWQAREVAGILAGLGVPAVFVGIFTVLPASQRVRAAAAMGAGIAVMGVALFSHAYPRDWAGYGANLTLPVVAVYFLGVMVTFWCLFVAVANFKTRNDPGGTVTLELTREGEVRTVEVEKGELEDFENLDDLRALQTDLADSGGSKADGPKTALGGVAFVGDTPDGETPTQTNQPGGRSSPPRSDSPHSSRSADSRSSRSQSSDPLGASPTSDGGTASRDIQSPLDDAEAQSQSQHRTADTYCGNCRYFQYVRTNEGMQPHCGFFGRTMDDMDACEEWEPNS
jgi:cytochrome c biogenesis protein CcdA